MSKESLEKQADRAETIADQTVDDQLKETLGDAAREYRRQAKREPSNRSPADPGRQAARERKPRSR
ncbi:MAG: hypothetical protein JOZ74_12310 [Bradyrhizobium sp.]|nr:hypothetical protein [Bradyrhizobium sp.]